MELYSKLDELHSEKVQLIFFKNATSFVTRIGDPSNPKQDSLIFSRYIKGGSLRYLGSCDS